ncbi:hypothetical protein PHYSODRAFT_324237 [Phytophthora sojae]|uniref:Elicitin n=1 Tax=Phytophthora sojae (strain P6497) TaxID=1094619 RepID=G4YSE7_PHYSP|nr:hypothetical protein PHYSODRAFT_324237 [Phytophthora sojae]EGZ22963.1 hypothetical protein PHYSODRAFT_324237 [Phytophthora sojae]|eukprot:XP_009518251.1 hypothetical protein PHYSODRAFT_324237 [Phytophthora sojae]
MFKCSFVPLVLLLACAIPVAAAAPQCSAGVSRATRTTLDNGKLFSSCAVDATGVRFDVDSLLDALNLPERDFLLFCRSSGCTDPVETLLLAIPTNCLITYHGSARNLSEEVSTLHHECAKVAGAADKTDEEFVYRYFLD